MEREWFSEYHFQLKSNANNNPLANRNLIVSFYSIYSLADLRNILNAVAADIAMIIPIAMSIPNVGQHKA
jgi:hypothetical protein